MNATIASPNVDSRKRMILPLSVFFLACFLFAGAIKFNLRGGDLWFAKPAGAPVTCSLLAVMGFLAARWFFGATPSGVPKLVLATLVVLLPLTGLLGVIQLATHDPVSSSLDATPLGGTIGSMLAGPRAFGAFGTTVAGIMFATLSLLGGYLARRITTKDEAAGTEDPFVLARAMSARRASATEEGAVAVAEPEAPADGGDRAGELFAHDAELEAEAPEAGVSEPVPLGAEPPEEMMEGRFETAEPQEETMESRFETVEPQEEAVEMRFQPAMEVVEEVEDVAEAIPEPPRRMSMLAGILEEAPEETEDEPIAPFLISPELFAEPEPMNEAGESLAMNFEEERETRTEVAPEPEAEPEEAPASRQRYALRPAFEAYEAPSMPERKDDDAGEDDAEIGMAEGGESPDLAPEWTAPPTRFHTPRLVQDEVRDEVPSGEGLFNILDVEQVQAPEPVMEAEPVVEEPPPPPVRPRFRVKAVVQEEAPAELQVDMPMEGMVEMRIESMMEAPAEEAAVIAAPVEIETPVEPVAEIEQPVIAPEVEDEDAQERPAYRRRKRRSPKAPEPQPVIEASEPEATAPEAEPVFAAPAPETTAPDASEVTAVEAQLDLPSMPEAAAPATEDADAESRRPRRRMRSAAKDWATWDEPKPRLRLVKGEESASAEATVETRDEAPPAKRESDDGYDRAVALVIAEDRCSVSLLQRNLGVTFGEATALIDRMHQHGVVGPYQPTGRRDVIKKKRGAAEEG